MIADKYLALGYHIDCPGDDHLVTLKRGEGIVAIFSAEGCTQGSIEESIVRDLEGLQELSKRRQSLSK